MPSTHTHTQTHTHPDDKRCLAKKGARVRGCSRDMLRKLVCKKICARKNDAFYLSFPPSPLSSCFWLSHISWYFVFLVFLSLVCFLWLNVRFIFPPIPLSTCCLLSLCSTLFLRFCLSVIAAVSWS